MTDLPAPTRGASREPFFTLPTLPKGGATVSAGGGMLSVGNADGSAGWTLPLPLPVGRELTPSLALRYSSAGGNDAFGAGWHCAPPAISRMTRFAVPRYTDADRMAGHDGEEILRDSDGPRTETSLPFSSVHAPHIVTPWVARSGGREQRLEHWRSAAVADSPGFWLCYHADASITLFGWSTAARLSDPADPTRVACWYAEETVSATGEHVVYTYRSEDRSGCDEQELAAHPHVGNQYLSAVHAMNATPSTALLIPADAFRPEDFMSVMVLDYGERGSPLHTPPPFEALAPWPVRQDCQSFWRWGFEVRVRRLCRDVLLWHRSAMMAGTADATPQRVSRLHLSYQTSGIASLLVAAQQAAYEADGTPLLLPPVEFELSRPGCAAPQWEALTDLDGFSAPGWQMADLYGDGIPGLLYQHSGAWRYRAAQRAAGAGNDALTWGAPQVLPLSPGLRTGRLTDLDSDGRVQWLVSLPGMHGSFTLAPDGQWAGFVPLQALPAELMHPAAQLADLSGSGRQDVVMIGPRSVRLWARAAGAWHAAEETAYEGPQALPVTGAEHRLVAFSDPAGSGQQHLLQITAQGVTYWPSLGHGRFAAPVVMSGFAVDDFKASRVLLGDTDGSGTLDILYREANCIRRFVNHSGNRYVESEPVPAPQGVLLDDRCQVQIADLRGQGTVELLLTTVDSNPRTWAYRFNDRRPWLLAEVCSNTGSRTLFDYRSSAQGWLDEKLELQAQGKPAVSHLPFALHVLSQVTTLDDITGLRTVSGMRYLRGIWDSCEREFRGFTRLIQTDALSTAQGSAALRSPATQVRHWFLSGIEEHDQGTPGAYAGRDSAEAEFVHHPPRFTRLQGESEVPYEPLADERRWLLRAFKGMPVRSEIYGLDGSEQQPMPYRITQQRWQLRACPTAAAQRPAALVTAVQTLTLNTERMAQDPRISQSLVLEQDACGYPLRSVQVHYPRRAPVQPSPYPGSLPPGLEVAARDPQQEVARLILTRNRVRHLSRGHIHLAGLVESSRTDVLQLQPHRVPPGGFSVEGLQASDGPLADLRGATLAGHLRRQWSDAQGKPSAAPIRQALVAYSETAMLDDAALASIKASLTEPELTSWLAEGGYHRVTLPEDGKVVHVGRHGLARYHGPQLFYRPAALRESEQVGEAVIGWSAHGLRVATVTDAAGLVSAWQHDWRWLLAHSVTDPNDNLQQVVFDALGRVVQSRFQGTQGGMPAGYHRSKAFVLPQTVEGMLALVPGTVPVATAHRVVADSWMPFARDQQGRVLAARCGELALRRWAEAYGLRGVKVRDGCEPVHVISLQTDRYDGDPQQQIRVQVNHSDGAGRLLQSAVLATPGEALVLDPARGLEVDQDGQAVRRHASLRWAVTGKTEYDNKGQAVRTWQPFYLDDWRPVQADGALGGLHADTHLYDALGRVYRVITAAGWERRTGYYPWFTVSEDENDTA
ncbi:SpvB/TcaC N-terminal domain-containing protein [Pseudomonas putida]